MTTGPLVKVETPVSKVLQVVLDTNVLMAALCSRRGASHRLLRLVGDPRWQINLSVPLLLEYEDVLKRPEAGHPLNPGGDGRRAKFSVRLGRPPGDLLPVAAGAAGPEGRLRAGAGRREQVRIHRHLQHEDFVGAEKFGVSAVRPQEFLRELGEIP